jgi:hypothetical protein
VFSGSPPSADLSLEEDPSESMLSSAVFGFVDRLDGLVTPAFETQ